MHFQAGRGQGIDIPRQFRKGIQDFPNYFSHIRFEDMADGKTRKILETQSDLFQKENFANEFDFNFKIDREVRNIEKARDRIDSLKDFQQKHKIKDKTWIDWQDEIDDLNIDIAQSQKEIKRFRSGREEIQPLQAYSSNDPLAHLRTFREEVKRAAKDGKDTLLIPSGETAMKIEGLGQGFDRGYWRIIEDAPAGSRFRFNALDDLTSDNLKVGMQVNNRGDESTSWIITDILGEGKFKAVPKEQWDLVKGKADPRLSSFWKEKGKEKFSDLNPKEQAEFLKGRLEAFTETFDISGKVDTQHFVYKLNEEAIPREARKMGLEVEGKIKEGRGEYWKIKIGKERARMPVEAFGVFPLAFTPKKKKENE